MCLMSKYFLIHGFGKALDLGEPEIPTNGGFYTFDTELETGEAYAFVWAQEYSRKWLNPLNLYQQLRLYYLERALTDSELLQSRLIQELLDYQPEVIIAHSLGARLLSNALDQNNASLPSSVQRIILCQADIPEWTYVRESLQIDSYHCWWDIALWSSVVLSQKIPLGLFSNSQSQVQSHFRGLYRGWNLHQDIWRDERYKEDIFEINKRKN